MAFITNEQKKQVENAISVLVGFSSSSLTSKSSASRLSNTTNVIIPDQSPGPSRQNQEVNEEQPGPSSSVTDSWSRFDHAYKDAISSLRGIRQSETVLSAKSGDVAPSKINSFKRKGPYKISSAKKPKKASSWTHKFVCLPSTDDDKVPTTTYAKESLVLAGLGEKKIVIPDVDCSTEEFHDVILQAFPKLESAGGFELLRCLPCTRELEIIPSPVCLSPRLLRARISTARIYVRPIQNDLEMEETEIMENMKTVTQVCLKCKQAIDLDKLRVHLQDCEGERIAPIIVPSDDDDDEEEEKDKAHDVSPLMSPFNSPPYSPVHMPSPSSYSRILESILEDNTELRPVQKDNISVQEENIPKFDTLKAVAEHLSSLTVTEELFSLSICRSNVLGSTLCGINRIGFSPNKLLEINFFGEYAQDGGGPRREFFRLLAVDVNEKMCIGQKGKRVLKADVMGVTAKQFKKIGQLMSMSLAQEGTGFPFFADCIFDYLCGKDDVKVDAESVPNEKARALLVKMQNVDDENSLQDIVMDAGDFLCDNIGYNKPLTTICLSNKDEVCSAIFLQNTTMTCTAELQQLKEGLTSLGVLNIMKENPEVVRPFFTYTNEAVLTADKIQKLLTVKFSDIGTNQRAKEEITYMKFIQLLNECEACESDSDHLTLEEVLVFFSGCVTVPPMGFDLQPTLCFNEENFFPKASTCALVFILPTRYDQYTIFKEKVTYGLKNHGGFGTC